MFFSLTTLFRDSVGKVIKMKYFTVAIALAFALAFVSAEESSNEAKPENPVNSAFRGHVFKFNENTKGREEGLKKLKELMVKNIGLSPVEKGNTQNREKRGFLLGHHQPIVQHQPVVHQPIVHQPVQHHYPQYQQYCPDYYVEYHYQPQDYCYY